MHEDYASFGAAPVTALGYALSALIGVSLGLVGAGGSILTVPVLVYLFRVPANLATTYSLFIVGVAAISGAIGYLRQGDVDRRSVVGFGLASSFGTAVTRGLVVPALPPVLFRFGTVCIERDRALLLLFAALMLGASYAMIRPTPPREPGLERDGVRLAVLGLVVGSVMGLVGAGGGFLIVPVLVLHAGLRMRQAVATSLVIVAVNSLAGFGAASIRQRIDWPLVGSISAMAIAGIWLGSRMAKRIPGARLKPAFGMFVLVMGTYVVVREMLG